MNEPAPARASPARPAAPRNPARRLPSGRPGHERRHVRDQRDRPPGSACASRRVSAAPDTQSRVLRGGRTPGGSRPPRRAARRPGGGWRAPILVRRPIAAPPARRTARGTRTEEGETAVRTPLAIGSSMAVNLRLRRDRLIVMKLSRDGDASTFASRQTSAWSLVCPPKAQTRSDIIRQPTPIKFQSGEIVISGRF